MASGSSLFDSASQSMITNSRLPQTRWWQEDGRRVAGGWALPSKDMASAHRLGSADRSSVGSKRACSAVYTAALELPGARLCAELRDGGKMVPMLHPPPTPACARNLGWSWAIALLELFL